MLQLFIQPKPIIPRKNPEVILRSELLLRFRCCLYHTTLLIEILEEIFFQTHHITGGRATA